MRTTRRSSSSILPIMRLVMLLVVTTTLLSNKNVFFVDASLGNMGFTSLKKIPGGFNAVVEEPDVKKKGELVIRQSGAAATSTIALPDRALLSLDRQSTAAAGGPVIIQKQKQQSAAAAVTTFNNKPQVLYQSIVLGTNALGFVISSLFSKWHYHIDLLGTGAFCFGALPAYFAASHAIHNSPHLQLKVATSNAKRIQLTSAAVMAWSTKLAAYLVWRSRNNDAAAAVNNNNNKNAQLDIIMQNPSFCAGFWIFSALWGIVCGLPFSMGLTSSAATDTDNNAWFQTGMSMFAAGWIVETLADYQKVKHKQQAGSNGGFLEDGLWSLSQHPNWFGNILLWSGICVANIPALIEPIQKANNNIKNNNDNNKKTGAAAVAVSLWQRIWSCRRVAVAALGPLFMLRLFDQQATGVMNGDNVQSARTKYGYGSNPEYTEYVDKTPLLFPIKLNW